MLNLRPTPLGTPPNQHFIKTPYPGWTHQKKELTGAHPNNLISEGWIIENHFNLLVTRNVWVEGPLYQQCGPPTYR